MSELEVTNFKRLEMIEKQNNFYITCLYFQEYKKGFAFLTKFHYFYLRKMTHYTFENFGNFLGIFTFEKKKNEKGILANLSDWSR